MKYISCHTSRFRLDSGWQVVALVVLALLVLMAMSVQAQSGGVYNLLRWTIDGGGGRSSSGDYVLGGAIGQPDAGVMNGGTYALAGGFWHSVGGGASETYYTLVVAQTGTGAGIITPTVGAHSYVSGTTVWLTATAASSSTFGGWQGAVSGSTNSVSILMDNHKAVTATFTLISGDCYTLTTTISPPGGGSVRVNPIPNCNGEQYTANTVVTLTAVSNEGYHFDHWGGAASGAQNPIALMLNTHAQATAYFTAVDYFLYLPLALRQWPPLPGAPTLQAIDNSDGDGAYAVQWIAADLAASYELQEDDAAVFSSPTTVYNGAATSWNASGKSLGTYYYRVRGQNTYGSGAWSDVQSVQVLPTIFTAVADTYVAEGHPDAYYGNELVMRIGYDPADGHMRGLVKFDFSSIPANTPIITAVLQVYYGGYQGQLNDPQTVTAHRMLSDWSETAVSWSGTASDEAYGAISLRPSQDPSGYYFIDVTDLVEGWISGTMPNYGVVLRSPENSVESCRNFTTKDYSSDPNRHPKLLIIYSGMALR